MPSITYYDAPNLAGPDASTDEEFIIVRAEHGQFVLTLGSDLILHTEAHGNGRYAVEVSDSSRNVLATLAVVPAPSLLPAAIEQAAITARQLFPNHLLTPLE